MTKFRKIFTATLSCFVALVMAAGIACLTINCSSEESAERGKTIYAEPVAYPEVQMTGYSSFAEAVEKNLSDTEAEQVALTLTDDYIFAEDEEGAEIPAGKYITVDLNGHTLDLMGTSVARAFVIYGTLTLTDSTGKYEVYTGSEEPGVYDNGDGTFTTVYKVTDETTYDATAYSYTSGAICGGVNTTYGGTVYLNEGGTFIMDGGILTGNSHSYGGAIRSSGSSSSRCTLIMNGGSISGNTSTNDGAGIWAEYTDIELSGGIISSNTVTGSSYCGGGLYILNSSTFYMDETGDIPMVVSHNNAKNGSGIDFLSSGTSAEIAGGHIEFNTSSSDAALYINGGVDFTLSGGFIGNNSAVNSGAGMYIRENATMTGGVIYGNKVTGTKYGGGGLLVYDSSTFTMTGGKIINNTSANYAGGICVYSGSKLVVNGGEISGNTCKTYGGGVYLNGKNTATIENCVMEGNETTSQGGGAVHVTSGCTCTMTNVTMKENSGVKGGAIDVRGTLTISDCDISENTATGETGGGLYINGGTVYMSDTVIRSNTASTGGGGVYLSGTLSVSGEIIIEGNTFGGSATAGNVLLVKGNYITLGGSLSTSSYIGLTLANESQTQITTEEDSTERYKSAGQYFDLDVDNENFVGYKSGDKYLQLIDGDEAAVEVNWTSGKTRYFDTLDGALTVAASESAETRGTAKLHRDVDVSSTITVAAGTYVALDLYGSTVSWTGSSKSNFFVVYGNFTLEDSTAKGGEYEGDEDSGVYKIASASSSSYMTVYDVMDKSGETKRYYYESGAITGGMATTSAGNDISSRGGAFYVGSAASMVMYGGTLYNNTGTYAGAVHTYGVFTMYGGSVSGNYSQNTSSKHNGAAFLNEGTMYISGGVIYGNTTTGTGYGGAIENAGTMYLQKLEINETIPGDPGLCGVVISGNYSSAYGGGIFNSSTLYIYDGYITLNEAKTDGGGINNNGGPVYMYGGYVTGNFVAGIGGGVCSPSSFYLYDGYISYNYSTGSYAGGIYMGSTSYFYGGEISNNSASKQGGGVYTVSTLYLYADGSDDGCGVKISENSAGSLGGGIYSTSNLYIYAGEISGNSAATNGGGVYSTSTLYIYGEDVSDAGCVKITENSASDSGGGVYGTSKIYIQGGEISKNTVKNYGGGVYASASATLEISGGRISENNATSSSKGQGAGVAVYGTATMSGGTISENAAGFYGGALIIADGATFTMTGGIMSGNTATRAGAVSISGKGSTLNMYGGEISGNSATTGNGSGVYAGNSGTYFTMTGGEISGNYTVGNAGGVFGNDSSTVKLLGGTVTGNFAKGLGAGVYFTSSASMEIGGDVVISKNYLGTPEEYSEDTENNLYIISGKQITVDSDGDYKFTGLIGVTCAANPSVQITKNTFEYDTFIEVVSGRVNGDESESGVTSDEGYCVGLNLSNGYVYLYAGHDAVVYLGFDESGAPQAYFYCSQCFENLGICSDLSYALDENGNATAYVDGYTCYVNGEDGEITEGVLSVTGGVLAGDGDGNLTWYEDISSALESLTEKGNIILLNDIDASEEGLTLSVGCDITLDLNGHTVTGGITVSSSDSSVHTFTIGDSLGGGEIDGTLSTETDTYITISASGGTFSETSFENITLVEGYVGLYEENEEGPGTYTIYSLDEVSDYAVAYIKESDNTKTIYFATLKTAIEKTGESTIYLCRDVTGEDFVEEITLSSGKTTIDLCGFTLEVEIKIEAGSADTEFAAGGSLEIKDSSETAGKVYGKIVVEGESLDQEETNNSFSETLKIVASAVDPDLSVDTSGLKSTYSESTVSYSFSLDSDSSAYVITAGHSHQFTIADAYVGSDGIIYVRMKCSCGAYYSSSAEGGENAVESADEADLFHVSAESVNVTDNGDGTVAYSVNGATLLAGDGSDSTFTSFSTEITITPLLSVTVGETTYYFDETTIGDINEILEGIYGEADTDKITITLWDNVDLEKCGVESLEISKDTTLDLNGHTLSGSITLFSDEESSTTLTVMDSSAVEDGSAIIGTGVFDCEIENAEGSSGTNSVFLESGSYTEKAVESLEELYGDIESCLSSDKDLTIIYNEDGGITVTTKDLAAKTAAVAVTIEDEEMYFASLQDAIDYIEKNSSEEATITLLSDLEEDVVVPEGVDVTIDLNGYTIYSDIEVKAGATLTIENNGDDERESNIEGKVYGFGSVNDNAGVFVVEIVSVDGETYYFSSVEEATKALSDGDTLIFLADIEETIYIDILTDGEVTIDLNGRSVAAELTASDGTILKIEDTAESAGLYTGTIFGNNVEIISGEYSEDVSGNLAEGSTLYVKSGSEAGEYIYVVRDSLDGDAFADAKIKIVSSEGVVTYYDDVETALAHVSFGDTVVLLSDITVGEDESGTLTIDGAGVFTIDLNGMTLKGSIEVSGNTSLTIIDSTETKDCVGMVTGSVSVKDEYATLVVEAGIYGEDPSGYAAEGKAALVISSEDETGNTYRILSEEDAEKLAAASVSFEGESGDVITIYFFDDISEAISYACSDSAKGSATVTLYKDVSSDVDIEITSGSVILDLNGNDVNGEISVTSGASLTIVGEGTYGGESDIEDIAGYLEDGLAAYVTENGVEIVDENYAMENAAVSISVGDVTIYFESFDEAVEYVNGYEGSETLTLTLLGDVTAGEDPVAITSDVVFDLNGHTFTGNVEVGDESSDTKFTVTNSDGENYGVFDGSITAKDSSSVALQGGSFTDSDVAGYLEEDETYVAIDNGENGVIVVSKEDVEKVAFVKVSIPGGAENDTVKYFMSLGGAIEYAVEAETSATVTILNDVEMTGEMVDVKIALTIDLNGKSAGVNIVILADEGGTLVVTDGTYVKDETYAGVLTGYVAVEGAQDGNSDENNPYAETLKFINGAAPNGELTVDLDALGTNVDYYFDAVTFDVDVDGFGIVMSHVHSYTIEVWTFAEGGEIYLEFMCACGEMLQGVIYTAEVEVEVDEDGNFVFTATVSDVDVEGGEPDGTYGYTYTADIVATVTKDGETYYFETLDAAIDFASTLEDSLVTLQKDCEDVATVLGTMTIDLNGFDLGGICAEEGSSVVIKGEGFVSSLDVEDGANVRLQGGTYDSSYEKDIETYVDSYSGYAVLVEEDGEVSVVSESYAKMNSAASVTGEDGSVTYYETLEDAIDALSDGDTLTLYSDASDETVEISGENITIDLNGFDLGELIIDEGASATVVGDGKIKQIENNGELSILGGTYDESTLELLEDIISSESGLAIMVGEDGSYTILSEDDALEKAIASVTFGSDDGAVTLYFEDMQAAISFAAAESGTVALTKDYSGDIKLYGEIELDLSGFTVEGGIEISEDAEVLISDSVGGGIVTGDIDAYDEESVKISGGTYYEDVTAYLVEGYVAIKGYDENGSVTYTVMATEEAKISAAAYVEFADGTVGYYEKAEDAIAAAIENGGTVILTSDADLGSEEYTISSEVVIDLNGHTLTGSFTVDTNSGGSLNVKDSSENNAGSLEGSVKVTGSGNVGADNPYEGALVFSEGASPNENLEIDLSALGNVGEETAYVLAYDSDSDSYVIESYSTHSHVYNIAVWEYDYASGCVTVKFMCACGAYYMEDGESEEAETYEIPASDVTIIMTGDGKAVVTCEYEFMGETYSCEIVVDVAAKVTGEDGETYYFESFDEALEYACETNGTLILNDDVTEAEIAIGSDSVVTIDLSGHTLEGSVNVSEGSTLIIVDSSEDGSGLLETTLEIDGTLIVDGAAMILTEDSVVGDSGEIIFKGDSSVDLGGNTLTGVTEIDGNLNVSGTTGAELVLADDVIIPEGSALVVEGSLTIDVCGCDFEGDIEVCADSSLVIIDSTGANNGSYEGTITLGEDSSLTMENDTYSDDAEIILPDGMMLQSTTGSDGEAAFEVVSQADHVGKGHGYDEVLDWQFNANTSSITITFGCMCGETVKKTVPVSESDYTAYVEGDEVIVEYDIISTVTAENGTTYSYHVYGSVSLEMYTEGEDDENYTYTVSVQADCVQEGEAVYTYGQGKGVVVKVTTPKDHNYIYVGTVKIGNEEYEYYVCSGCGKYVLEIGDAMYEYENEENLKADAEAQDTFESTKESTLAELDEQIDSLLADLAESLGENSDAYKAAVAAVEEVYDEYRSLIENAGYDAATGIDELKSILIDATQSSYEASSGQIIDSLYQELLESGKYEGTALDSLNDIFDELASDLGKITVDSIESIKEIYDAFLERAETALEGVTPSTAFTSEASDISGNVVSSEGVSASVEFVIESKDASGTYVSAEDFVYVGEYDYTEEDINNLVEGKGVAAVFDISLYDASTESFVYRYKGTYVVSIKLDDDLLGLGGLQVIYVGSDGRAEVYDTYVTSDGYLVFTTTHFSEFLLLSSDVEENEPPVESDGAVSGRTSDGVPVEIIIILCVIVICAVVIIIVMCESFKPAKKKDE
ncbi:MAG: hypothetical protein LUD29_04570 [Clostridia bacterium]|nr:hypothetical protein [Clostridia bacterium]